MGSECDVALRPLHANNGGSVHLAAHDLGVLRDLVATVAVGLRSRSLARIALSFRLMLEDIRRFFARRSFRDAAQQAEPGYLNSSVANMEIRRG